MPRAKSQLQIRIRLAALHLASRRLLARPPSNTLAGRISWRNLHRATCKSIPEDIAHVVPNLVNVEIVREIRLADVWLENAAFHRAYLERDTTRDRVAVEGLTVRRVFGDDILRANATAYGPEIKWFIALVCYDRATDSMRTNSEGDGCNNKLIENHDEDKKRVT
jgi:hypothetical protein